ncbi:MAG: PH domain-containing protein [Eggerthellaceae bacterium]|nr:PH domain-containing protein [Eggerthellaceae bacterium]
MKFCPECGTNIEGMKFCPECGFKVEAGAAGAVVSQQDAPVVQQPIQAQQYAGEQIIAEFSTFLFGLEDKNTSIAGGRFDVSIPQFRYTLTNERLIAENKGVVSSKRDEFELFKLRDVSVKQSLLEKAQGVGTITVTSTDPGTPMMVMERIKDPEMVKEAIRSAAQARKSSMGIHYHEGAM